jgi:hypothetical protein
MIGAMLLISDFLSGGVAAACSTAVVASGVAWAWFGSPLARRLRSH